MNRIARIRKCPALSFHWGVLSILLLSLSRRRIDWINAAADVAQRQVPSWPLLARPESTIQFGHSLR